jgi:hypothetical protein
VSQEGDDVLLARMAMRILDAKASKFVISVAGSSVTAGHDGFGTAAW